jgi:uncharacterized membrane protein
MLKKLMLAPAAIAVLSGCVASLSPTEQPSEPTAYIALGTEPFWNLEIAGGMLNFNRPDAPRIAGPYRGPTQDGAARVYRSPRISVRISPGPCSDGMSDRRYPDHVELTVDGRNFTGCGGNEAPRPAASLERSSWRITHINGQPALADVEADFSFADGRISGTAGCNRVNGSYSQNRNVLTFGALAMTRMACMGARGAQEDAVTRILGQPLTIRFGERMTMTWTATDGSSIALRRLDWD